jgi:hypothetical protein
VHAGQQVAVGTHEPAQGFVPAGQVQLPPWHTWVAPQLPHDPPQPFSPQVRSLQLGVHVADAGFFLFFLFLFFLPFFLAVTATRPTT